MLARNLDSNRCEDGLEDLTVKFHTCGACLKISFSEERKKKWDVDPLAPRRRAIYMLPVPTMDER